MTMEILDSIERSFNLGSTLLMLSSVWIFIGCVSNMFGHKLHSYVEITISFILYISALLLMLNGIAFAPVLCMIRLIIFTCLIIIPLFILYLKNKKREDNTETIS